MPKNSSPDRTLKFNRFTFDQAYDIPDMPRPCKGCPKRTHKTRHKGCDEECKTFDQYNELMQGVKVERQGAKEQRKCANIQASANSRFIRLNTRYLSILARQAYEKRLSQQWDKSKGQS